MVNATNHDSILIGRRDRGVLDLVMHPEAAPRTLQLNESAPEALGVSPIDLKRAKDTELAAVRLAEKGKLDEAIELLTSAIDTAPYYASLYNNRAQAYRLKREHVRALEDLTTAIRLASPETPSSPVHPKVARALAQAHTQRAAILHSGAKLPGFTPAQREDALSHDLFMGGHYGNELAKTLSVALNPYAKMCGAIIQTSLTEEYAESLKA